MTHGSQAKSGSPMTGTEVSEMSGSNRHDDIVQADDKIALLDEWARIGDVLSAEQDAVANEAYLGRRTRRFVWVSVGITGLAVAAMLADLTARRRRMRRIHSTG
jgi:hypothetical protein